MQTVRVTSTSAVGANVLSRRITRMVPTHAMKDRVAQLPAVDPSLVRIRVPAKDAKIENVDGKRASFQIFSYLAKTYGKLDKAAAEKGLEIYDEIVADAIARPGAHPNIDMLIEIRDKNQALELVLEHQ